MKLGEISHRKPGILWYPQWILTGSDILTSFRTQKSQTNSIPSLGIPQIYKKWIKYKETITISTTSINVYSKKPNVARTKKRRSFHLIAIPLFDQQYIAYHSIEKQQQQSNNVIACWNGVHKTRTNIPFIFWILHLNFIIS